MATRHGWTPAPSPSAGAHQRWPPRSAQPTRLYVLDHCGRGSAPARAGGAACGARSTPVKQRAWRGDAQHTNPLHDFTKSATGSMCTGNQRRAENARVCTPSSLGRVASSKETHGGTQLHTRDRRDRPELLRVGKPNRRQSEVSPDGPFVRQCAHSRVASAASFHSARVVLLGLSRRGTSAPHTVNWWQ